MNKSESKYFNTAIRFDKALLSLLEKKTFDYITIREVCEEAGVNRSTFYLHYDNLADLLRETSTYVLDTFSAYFNMDYHNFTDRFSECRLEDLNFIDEKYLIPYLSFIRENQRLFKAVLSHPEIFQSHLIFQRLFDDIFNPILERFHYPPEDRRYVILFYLNGLTAIMMEWIQNGCQKNDAEISGIIHTCIFGRKI